MVRPASGPRPLSFLPGDLLVAAPFTSYHHSKTRSTGARHLRIDEQLATGRKLSNPVIWRRRGPGGAPPGPRRGSAGVPPGPRCSPAAVRLKKHDMLKLIEVVGRRPAEIWKKTTSYNLNYLAWVARAWRGHVLWPQAPLKKKDWHLCLPATAVPPLPRAAVDTSQKLRINPPEAYGGFVQPWIPQLGPPGVRICFHGCVCRSPGVSPPPPHIPVHVVPHPPNLAIFRVPPLQPA
eukprot:gene22739-biopygen16275